MLHYNTVSTLLQDILKTVLEAKELEQFRLVGGTALSLYYGHRMSVDIDLFTDADYGTIDFEAIESFLRNTYTYVDTTNHDIIGMGKSYYVGESIDNAIKLDVYYTDPFIDGAKIIDNIRLATIEEIVAMKLDVVLRTGRKKDFWDIHELNNDYPLEEMFALHEKRYPYTHNRKKLLENFSDFTEADEDFDPICLKGKHWELIKLDIMERIYEVKS
jgi:predicted nucleotidyltransferase component of viral defense system